MSLGSLWRPKDTKDVRTVGLWWVRYFLLHIEWGAFQRTNEFFWEALGSLQRMSWAHLSMSFKTLWSSLIHSFHHNLHSTYLYPDARPREEGQRGHWCACLTPAWTRSRMEYHSHRQSAVRTWWTATPVRWVISWGGIHQERSTGCTGICVALDSWTEIGRGRNGD